MFRGESSKLSVNIPYPKSCNSPCLKASATTPCISSTMPISCASIVPISLPARPISGTTPTFTCQRGQIPFNDTESASGFVSKITWTTDVSGNGTNNTFKGAFSGDLEPPGIIGNITVSYSFGTGTAKIPVTLKR